MTDKILGKGNHSTVYLGVHQISRKNIAMKIFFKDYLDVFGEMIQKEVDLLKMLRNCEFIIQLENSFFDELNENFYMIFELADMNLETFISGRGYLLSELECLEIFVKILNGIWTLHEKCISHGDVKLENIFVFKKNRNTGAEGMCIKIGDLGFSAYCDDDNLLNMFCGSPLYAAPEITLGIPYNGMLSDIWSIGIVFYVLCYGRFPFDVKNDGDIKLLFNKIQNDLVYFDEERGVSEECKNLMSHLLSKNPNDRPFVHQIINHPLIVGDVIVVDM